MNLLKGSIHTGASFFISKKVVEILMRIKKGLLHWWRDQCHQEQSLSTEYNYNSISMSFS